MSEARKVTKSWYEVIELFGEFHVRRIIVRPDSVERVYCDTFEFEENALAAKRVRSAVEKFNKPVSEV